MYIHLTPLANDALSLLLALLLGGIIGLERQMGEHPAGLRTHILVCIGSAMITLIDKSTPNGAPHITPQIVTGIGFLGAGTIMREGNGSMVRGLTTAAGIWTVAAIGIGVGTGGMYAMLAIIFTVIVFVTLALLDNFEEAINRTRRQQELTFVIATQQEPLQRMAEALNGLHELGIRTGKFRCDGVPGGQIVHMTIKLPNSSVHDKVKPTLEANPNIVHVEWGPGA